MAAETRIVLVKPGDILMFGNVGGFDLDAVSDALGALTKELGLRHVYVFEDDIDLAVVPDGSTA